MNIEKIVDIIYNYQIEKNKIVKEDTGVTLIPEFLRLTKEEIADTKFIEFFYDRFVNDSIIDANLNAGNCLNCIKHSYIQSKQVINNCSKCKYQLNYESCDNEGSLYQQAANRFSKNGIKRFKKLIEKTQKELKMENSGRVDRGIADCEKALRKALENCGIDYNKIAREASEEWERKSLLLQIEAIDKRRRKNESIQNKR